MYKICRMESKVKKNKYYFHNLLKFDIRILSTTLKNII